MVLFSIREFLRLEAAGGILLMAAAVIALVWANSPASAIYISMLDLPVVIQIGEFKIAKPLLLWINDGLMAVFFLLIGLEIKREVLEGELSSLSRIALPGIAAAGGMIVPSAIYLLFNAGDSIAVSGWAIPAATDIAFALAVLALLGGRAAPSLKVLLLAVAIIDDLGAIMIIALFYTSNLSFIALALALAGLGAVLLVVLNLTGVTRVAAYVLVGVFLWACVLKSGVHATLAGVATDFAIPLRTREETIYGDSPLRRLEHILHPWVVFGILPVFALANAGVPLAGLSLASLFGPVPLGIAAGLFLGKQIGVLGASWVAIRSGVGALPEGASWTQFYGMSLLTGIGFTMSLFIGGLAFADERYSAAVRMGVLGGSLLSAVAGYLVIYFTSKASPAPRTRSSLHAVRDGASEAGS